MHFDNFTNKRSHPPLYPPCTTWQLQKYTSKNSPDTGTALKDSQTLLCVYFKEPCKPQKVDSAWIIMFWGWTNKRSSSWKNSLKHQMFLLSPPSPCGLHCGPIRPFIREYVSVHCVLHVSPNNKTSRCGAPLFLEVTVVWNDVCSETTPRRRALQQETLCGLFWSTLVGLLPRQQQLEKTRLPSRERLCFLGNQGQEDGSGFTWFLRKLIQRTCYCSRYTEALGSCSNIWYVCTEDSSGN